MEIKVRKAPIIRESTLGIRADGILYDTKRQKKDSAAYLDEISDLDEDSNSISNSSVSQKKSSNSVSQNKSSNSRLTDSAGKLPFSGFMKDPEKNQPYDRKKTSNSIMLENYKPDNLNRSNTILGKVKGFGGYGVTAI